MKIAFFDSHRFELEHFISANERFGYPISFLEPRLTEQTVSLAQGFECVCAFVNDRLNSEVLKKLKASGTRLVALRSAGFNNVDLETAGEVGIRVVRVPEYSPYAVAEHAVALIFALNRKIHRAYSRVREGNFSLDGLVGFDLHGKTVGIIGTGKIGSVMAKIMRGVGCLVLAYDILPDRTLELELGVKYVELNELLRRSDIVSLHVPLSPYTHHLINAESLSLMKRGVMLINTGRGALIDTAALVRALKTGQVGFAGLDVYEEEEGIFFEDLSNQVIQDDVLARLLTFPNVLLTSHQGFLTVEALQRIAFTTLQNVQDFEQGRALSNEVHAQEHLRKAV